MASELRLSSSSPGISESLSKKSLRIRSYIGQCRRKMLIILNVCVTHADGTQ